jgi:hypothetical protein
MRSIRHSSPDSNTKPPLDGYVTDSICFHGEELQILCEWFDVMQDCHGAYLEKKDFLLACRLYVCANRRVTNEMRNKIGRAEKNMSEIREGDYHVMKHIGRPMWGVYQRLLKRDELVGSFSSKKVATESAASLSKQYNEAVATYHGDIDGDSYY